MAAAQPPPELRSYDQLFRRDDMDPHNGSYSSLLNAFRLDQTPHTPAELFRLATANDADHPQAFLALIHINNTFCYQCYHSVKAYNPELGRTTPWDNHAYAFVGDYIAGGITTVEFPTDAFEIAHNDVSQVVPSTLARARELLAQEPDRAFLGDLNQNEPHTATKKTRQMMAIPHRYTADFLEPVPAREAFIQLGTKLENDGLLEDCKELVDWMLVSIIEIATHPHPSTARTPLKAPTVDRALRTRRSNLLYQHLPGLRTPAVGSLASVNQTMAMALNNLVAQNQAHQDQITARQDRLEKQTVKKFLSDSKLRTLFRYTYNSTNDESTLPAVWRLMAEANGKVLRGVLDDELSRVARTKQMWSAAPLATSDLTNKIRRLEFGGSGPDNLESGIHPFSIVLQSGYIDPSNQAIAAQARMTSSGGDAIEGGGAASVLQDVIAIQSTKIVLPTRYNEMKTHIFATAILWETLLGNNHPFVISYNMMAQNLQAYDHILDLYFTTAVHAIPVTVLFCRRVQLAVHNYWWMASSSSTMPSVPPFGTFVMDLLQQNAAWIPLFPSGYLGKSNPVDAASLISGLTTPTTESPSQEPAQPAGSGTTTTSGSGRGADVHNTAYNAQFEPYKTRAQAAVVQRLVEVAGPVPKVIRPGNTAPRVMCFSYHVKGKCFANCRRAYDHGPHTASEDEPLQEWVQRAFP